MDSKSSKREIARPADFEIAVDRQRKVIRMIFRGAFDEGIAARFEAELARNIRLASADGIPSGEFLALVDMRGMPLHSKGVASQLQASTERFGHFSRRVAIVMQPSTLQAMQIKRIAPLSTTRMFAAIDAAEQWLLGDDGDA